MVRVLTIGSYRHKLTDDATYEKFAVHAIQRELHYANEANLLEERDMYVFGSRPLKDPLHLVCCNACKKPVKSSQYAAHAELCRSFGSAEVLPLELDGGTCHKKPLNRGRKKLQAKKVTAQGRSESLVVDGFAISDCSGCGVLCSHSAEIPRAEHDNTLKAGAALPCDCITTNQKAVEVIGHNSDFCAQPLSGPIATKIYHLHRSQRLRASIGRLYRESCVKKQDNRSSTLDSSHVNDVLFPNSCGPVK